LGYCNSAINPFIYALFARDFRNPFKTIICKLFCKVTLVLGSISFLFNLFNGADNKFLINSIPDCQSVLFETYETFRNLAEVDTLPQHAT
jgi:hypothetical protein